MASILFLLPVMALTALPARTLAPTGHEGYRQVTAQAQAAAEFTSAVNRYVELHRLLENPMSCLTWGNDLEQTARVREAHRNAIVEARIAMPRGDIFTPRVAAYLRHELLMATDYGRMARAEWTEAALARLPLLPDELEYRFVDDDLVLLDTETLLVVDILENALPSEAGADVSSEEDVAPCAPEVPPVMKGSPCEAHPELEMCWS